MKKFDAQRFFASKRVLMVLSLLLGIIAWLVVSIVVDPNVTTVINSIPVQVQLTGSAQLNGLDVVDQDDLTVNAQITGAIYTVGNLTADDFTATVDASDITEPGTYQLEVMVTKNNTHDETYNVDYPVQSTLSVTLDRFEEATFTVEASVSNKTVEQEGYFMGELVSNPTTVTLTGPAAEVERIDRVVLENTEAMTLTRSTTVSGTFVFYDENGARLEQSGNVTADAVDPRITMPVYQRMNLPLTFEYINVPLGLNIDALDYSMSNETISIGVPVDAGVSLESISLGQIDVRNIEPDYSYTFDVSLPAGYLNLSELLEVTVTFTDELDSTQVTATNIVTTNRPSDYSITVNTDRLSGITFVGMPEDVAGLTGEDVVVTLDFANVRLTRGEQRVRASISLNNGAMAWAVGEYYISITATPSQTTQ